MLENVEYEYTRSWKVIWANSGIYIQTNSYVIQQNVSVKGKYQVKRVYDAKKCISYTGKMGELQVCGQMGE